MENHFCSVKSSVNFTVYGTKREADLVSRVNWRDIRLINLAKCNRSMLTTQSHLNSVPKGGGGGAMLEKNMENHFCSIKSSINFTVYGTKREADLVFASKPEMYSLNQFSQVQSKHADNAITP